MDDPDAAAREWHVEQIDSDGDGGWDLAIFTGPHAEQRANRYAEQLADMSRSAPLSSRSRGRRKNHEFGCWVRFLSQLKDELRTIMEPLLRRH